MAKIIHVNSTMAGTPTSPYGNWDIAAQTFAAAAAAAAIDDEIFVHPSHSETSVSTVTWPGTVTNPNKIICGTPTTGTAAVGITALQNTAQWAAAAGGSNVGWGGSTYTHGISFRMIGSTGSAILTLNPTQNAISTFNDCQLYWSGTAGSMAIGGNVASDGATYLSNFTFRYNATGNIPRLTNRVIGNNIICIGSVTPTNMFAIGNGTIHIVPYIEFDGFDFSTFANTVKLTTTFSKMGFVRIRNAKVPTGWCTPTNAPTSSEIITGSRLEILNYGDSDTNSRFWIEEKQGRCVDEQTIKYSSGSASPSGNSKGTYSKRLWTLGNVAYPSSVWRGPAIGKYLAANNQYKGIYVHLASDGAVQFNNKEFWLEVTFPGVDGFPQSGFLSSCPAYGSFSTTLPTSTGTWVGFTNGVTTGPNGSSTWNKNYVYLGGIPLREDGWVIVTPCFAAPSKQIFINDDFTVQDEGGPIT